MSDLIDRQAAIDASKNKNEHLKTDQNALNEDLISRKTAIDAIEKIFPVDPMRNDYTQGITCGAALATEYIKQLPSAQPEKRTDKCTETHSCDCIERQAAIDAHYEYCNKHPDAGFPVWSLKILEDLPSAQPERKKGKWIPETEDWRNQIVWVKCSECGFDTSTSYNYCPNCGCRMDGGEQDE